MLLLLLFLIVSAAEEDPLQHRAAAAFSRGMNDAGALSRALGAADHPDIDTWAGVLQGRLANGAAGALGKMLGRVAGDAAAATRAADALLRKMAESKDGGTVARVRAKAKEALRTLLGSLGQGRRNLDDCMDHVARLRFSDVVEMMRREVSSGVRESFDNFPEGRPEELSGELRRSAATFPLEGEAAGLRAFGAWTREAWRRGTDAVRDEFGVARGTTMELISRSKDAAAAACRAAMDVLGPFEEALGPQLAGRLRTAAREAVGQF